MPCGYDADDFETPLPPLRREPPEPTTPDINERMDEDTAWSVAIDFGMCFGLSLAPKKVGAGYSAMVPMELLKRYLPLPVEPPNRTLLHGSGC